MITYWKHLNLITVKDGILCKKWIKHDKETNEIEIQRSLVLVPESLKETVLDQHHSSLVSMHPGVDNTCNLIRQRYYWPRMKDEVELYFKSCVTCGGCKQPWRLHFDTWSHMNSIVLSLSITLYLVRKVQLNADTVWSWASPMCSPDTRWHFPVKLGKVMKPSD